MHDDVADYSKLGVEERCVHKLWQARQSGYDMAARLFTRLADDKVSEWNRYGSYLKAFISDKNAAAQEKGLEAATAYIENCPKLGRFASDLLPVAIQCLAVQRSRAQKLAVKLVLALVEVKSDATVEELLLGLRSKNPKVAQASLSVLREAVNQYGTKMVNVTKIVKALPDILGDKERLTREEGVKLAVELHRWGVPLKHTMSVIKPVQKCLLEEEFAKLPRDPPVPKKILKSLRLKKHDGGGEPGEINKTPCDKGEKRLESSPVECVSADILSKLTDDFFCRISSKKWSDRKSGLDCLIDELTNVKKLGPGEYGDLILALTNIVINDTNVLVIGCALLSLALIINGMGKRFIPYIVRVLPSIVAAFKEKKVIVSKNCRKAIDALLTVASLEEIWPELRIGVTNKNPLIRYEVLMAIARWIGKQQSIPKKLISLMCSFFSATLFDSEPNVRDAAAIALASVASIAGEPIVNSFLTDLSDVKVKKVQDLYGKKELWAPIVDESEQKLSRGSNSSGQKLPTCKDVASLGVPAPPCKQGGDCVPSSEVNNPPRIERPKTPLTPTAPKSQPKKTQTQKLEVKKPLKTGGQIESRSPVKNTPTKSNNNSVQSPNRGQKNETVRPGSRSGKKNKEDVFQTVRELLKEGSNASCKLKEYVDAFSNEQLHQIFLTDDIKREPRLWAEALASLGRLLFIRGYHDPKIQDEASAAAKTSNDFVRKSANSLLNTLQCIAKNQDRRLSL